MVTGFKRTLIAGGAVVLASVTFAGAAEAVATANYSASYTEVKRCAFGALNCTQNPGQLQVLDSSFSDAFGGNASASSTPVDYSGITTSNFGSAFASVSGSSTDFIDLHATTIGTVVAAGDVTGYSWNFASAQGVVGFTNTSNTNLIIDINSFIGTVDYTSDAPNTAGFVGASLALLSNAIENVNVGDLWFDYSNVPGYSGQFAAGCGTAGAIALSNGPTTTAASGSFVVAPTSCSGATNFTVGAGDSFYLWGRLSTFRAATGTTDAGSTFHIGFNPTLSEETRAVLTENLVQAPGLEITGFATGGVPEPSTWAMMIFGFAGVGACLRSRRQFLSIRP